MRQGDSWDLDAAREYDIPGTGRFAGEVLTRTVDRLAEPAAGGRAPEFAIGTGRVGVPLAERGVPVTGFELETRHADWTGTEFTADSRSHVSVCRLPTAS